MLPPSEPTVRNPASPSVVPSTAPSTSMAVLFADIAGSTNLYDTLGDTQAKKWSMNALP